MSFWALSTMFLGRGSFQKLFWGLLIKPKNRFACRMTPTVRMNFQSDPKFTAALWACPGCKDSVSNEVIGCRDTQDHVLICPAYAAFRQGKDLSKDTELVKYFQNIIQQRLTS